MLLVHLWSSPRNISTALMYSFAQRSDMQVVDEPLYAYYLQHQTTAAIHPGREAILASQPTDARAVLKQLYHASQQQPILLCKQMTHHLLGWEKGPLPAPWSELLGTSDKAAVPEIKNVLLIRDPRAILASYSKVVEAVSAEDVGIIKQYELFQSLQAKQQVQAVVDSRRLLQNPKDILTKLCAALDIPFDPKMLRWEAGPRPEDGVWAPYWYANVHKSTGFQLYQEKAMVLSPELEELATDLAPYYEALLEAALV